MIDFHCHIDLYENPAGVIDQCVKLGTYVLSVTTTPQAWPKTNTLIKSAKNIRTALGLHPQVVHERMNELSLFDYLLDQTKYIGEVGLDGSPEFRQHFPTQVMAFEHILRSSSRSGGKIISIHSRKAESAVLDVLTRFPDAGIPVLHWFAGNSGQLQRAIDIGCWFSVGPAMIRSKKGRSLIESMPRDKILTESDGPFVKINNRAALPTDMEIVSKELGKVWALSINESEQLLINSFNKLCRFGA